MSDRASKGADVSGLIENLRSIPKNYTAKHLADQAADTIEALLAERDAARAAIDRVQILVDQWSCAAEAPPEEGLRRPTLGDFRAALDPEESP